MGCVNIDGSISDSAHAMLNMLAEPMTPEQAAERTGQPLFKIRSSLREMIAAGFIELEGEHYRTTDLGRIKAAESAN